MTAQAAYDARILISKIMIGWTMLRNLKLNTTDRKLAVTGAVVLGIVAAAIVLSLAATKDRGPPPAASAADGAATSANADQLWSKACAKDQNGSDVCYVEQFAIAKPQNVVLLHVRIGYLAPEGKPRMILAAPNGVLLPGGLTLTLDQNKPILLPFNTCDASGCLAAVDMDQDALNQFTTGSILVVRYMQANNSPIDIPIRMADLSNALTNISAK
ncbi:MAG: invasion associated locus B family protein [Niveispirillum sp.]|uniref:invasion associated locus B family protein n=1 Tax=Niveispirillum sp. TaxID=1917217 RepID=UPI003BA689AE